jgi:transcription antitermination factor NusG
MSHVSTAYETDKPWHVVRVRANAERQVERSLLHRDITVFLPLQKRPGKNRQGVAVEGPLFPGYIFASFDNHLTLPVVTCPGVVHILCRGNILEVVDHSEMFALQTVAREAHALLPLSVFCCGEKVKIRQGPLADVEGIVLRDEGGTRLVVSVSMLQRSVVAEVDREWLERTDRTDHDLGMDEVASGRHWAGAGTGHQPRAVISVSEGSSRPQGGA